MNKKIFLPSILAALLAVNVSAKDESNLGVSRNMPLEKPNVTQQNILKELSVFARKGEIWSYIYYHDLDADGDTDVLLLTKTKLKKRKI